MVDKKFTVLDLLSLELHGHDEINLRCIAGRKGLSRQITVPDINRPGLALSGFYESFAYQRVQVFGRGEYAYLNKLDYEGKTDTIKLLFHAVFLLTTLNHREHSFRWQKKLVVQFL